MTELFGVWLWWIIAAVLLIGEMMMPGIFLIWFAAAAALTAIVDLVVGFDWKGEVITFSVLSFGLVIATWKMVSASWEPQSDQPHLNKRLQGYIGQVHVLKQPITQGVGKLTIQDAVWDITGPDLQAGEKVRVTGADGMRLAVEKS
jgi:inner membrane protein